MAVCQSQVNKTFHFISLHFISLSNSVVSACDFYTNRATVTPLDLLRHEVNGSEISPAEPLSLTKPRGHATVLDTQILPERNLS